MLARLLLASLVLFSLLVATGCSRPEAGTETDASAEADAALADAAGEVLAQGQFVDKGGQQTSGSFRLERAGGDLRLILEDDFRTDEGPDLHGSFDDEETVLYGSVETSLSNQPE